MRHRPRPLLLLVVSAIQCVAACGGEEEAPVPDPDATAYAAALLPFLPASDPEKQPKVFVSAIDEALTLEEQVAVIDTIGDDYDVTFVDDPETAVDADADGRPVRDEGVLLLHGRIPAEPPYALRVEVYRAEHEVTASIVTLVWRTNQWAVGTDESVEPEAVILDE